MDSSGAMRAEGTGGIAATAVQLPPLCSTSNTVAPCRSTISAGNTASLPATTIDTPPVAGYFRVCAYILVTTAGTSGSLTAQVGYNPGTGTKSANIGFSTSITTAGNDSTSNGMLSNAGCVTLIASASTPITIAVNLVGTGGSLQYSAVWSMEQLSK